MTLQLNEEETEVLVSILKDAMSMYVKKKTELMKNNQYSKYIEIGNRQRLAQSIKYRLEKYTAAG